MIKKKKRVKDKKVLAKIHETGYCEYCGNTNGLQAHHVKTKASGGDDTYLNLILLCYICHVKAHSNEIKKEDLIKIIEKRNKYEKQKNC